MIKYKFLTGDVNWQEYGGKFISKKYNNGDWDYWLVMEVINLWEATGDETQSKYYVSVNVVAPDAVSNDEKEKAIQSCGGDWYNELNEKYKQIAMVEILSCYGTSACLWQKDGNNLHKLMQEARKESELINMLFGFYMDRRLNAIGSTGWDFISGDILAGLYKR